MRLSKKSHLLMVFFCGFLFATGLAISGMGDPSKVIGFLDISGSWDPTLAFVMTGGLIVYALAYQIMKKRHESFFKLPFNVPSTHRITPRLLLGACIFGVGWGLSGICPGPAILRLPTMTLEAASFVAMMFVGFVAARER